MSEGKNDGGPAYPRTGFYAVDGEIEFDTRPFDGMSLLDAFAKGAMEALLTNDTSSAWAVHAVDAYDMAEAMIVERDKRSKA